MKRFKMLLLAVVITIAMGRLTIMAAEKWKVLNSTQKFIVNGKPVNAAALNINDSNYIKVAEFAQLLDIDIHFNAKTNTITFDKTKPYDGVRTGENNMGNTSNFRTDGNMKMIDFSIAELKGNETLLISGMFLNKGEIIQYDISGEGPNNLAIYCTNSQSGQSDTISLYSAVSRSEGSELKISDKFLVDSFSNQYYFYATNMSDQSIQNISGTITARQ